MNPRIYKKQAKRALELIRSYGGWPEPVNDSSVYKVSRWDHPQGSGLEKSGFGIDGCLVFGGWGYFCDGREWDETCVLTVWEELHYWTLIVPDNYNGVDELPRMTKHQRWQRMQCSQIAPGWRWRGGKAVKISK